MSVCNAESEEGHLIQAQGVQESFSKQEYPRKNQPTGKSIPRSRNCMCKVTEEDNRLDLGYLKCGEAGDLQTSRCREMRPKNEAGQGHEGLEAE